jgi:hypothetical protein
MLKEIIRQAIAVSCIFGFLEISIADTKDTAVKGADIVKLQKDYSELIYNFDGDKSFIDLILKFEKILSDNDLKISHSFEKDLDLFIELGLLKRQIGSQSYNLALSNINKNDKIICNSVASVFWNCITDTTLATNELIFPGTDEILLIPLLYSETLKLKTDLDYKKFCSGK